jgi:hypothetical protein
LIFSTPSRDVAESRQPAQRCRHRGRWHPAPVQKRGFASFLRVEALFATIFRTAVQIFRREIPLKLQMEFAKFQRLDSSNGIDGVSLTLSV